MPYPDGFSSYAFNRHMADRREPRDLNAVELADITAIRATIAALEACKATVAALPQNLATSPDHEPRHVIMGIEDEIELLNDSIAEIERMPVHELDTLSAA